MKRCYNHIGKLIEEVDGMQNINRKSRTEITDKLKELKKRFEADKLLEPITINEYDETDSNSDENEYDSDENEYDSDENDSDENDSDENDSDENDSDENDSENDLKIKNHNKLFVGKIITNALNNESNSNSMVDEIKQKREKKLNNIKLSLKSIVEWIKQLRKINKDKNISDEFNAYCKDVTLPKQVDILKLQHVPYEEKKELLDMLGLYYCMDTSYHASENKIKLRDKINFRLKNLRSIRGKAQQKKYKRSREIADISYKEILQNKNISDDETAHLIRRINNENNNLNENYDNGVVSMKRMQYELINGGHEETLRIELYKKITESNMPKKYKKKCYFMLSSSDEDDYKVTEFVKLAVQLPYNQIPYEIPDTMEQMYTKFKSILDEELYGMGNVKEELITSVICKIFSPDAKYKAIALVGPAGTGKTTIARCIAKSFNLPFQQISMNAVSNGSDLSGHNYTYVGAQPGRIAKALMEMKCNNGVIFLDELDKVNDSPYDSVQNVLMNILDPSQNNQFVDNYFQDFKIDLSNILFVCSLNNTNKLNYILTDRIKLIQVHGYNENEKAEICKKMISKTLNQLQMTDIYFSDDVIHYLIQKDNNINKLSGEENTGVRGLESIVKHIIERLKVLSSTMDKPLDNISYLIPNFQLPFHLSKDDVNILLVNYGTDGKGRMDILQKINKSMIPMEGKQKLREMLANTTEHDCDYNKIMEYIKRSLKVPFNKVKYNIPSSVAELYNKFKELLDKELYGMEKVKEEIATSICSKFVNETVKYKAIALAGPPGTGKTTIARCIAKVFDVPFAQISMNIISRGSDLTGHNYTFVGSQPGRITKALMQMKCNNGVLYLDEIDKISNNGDDSASDALINILDAGQNSEFIDNYFQDFNIDLSNLLIVCSLNDIDKLDKIVADRIKIIKIKGYDYQEKLEIAKGMIKKTSREFNVDLKDIIFNDEVIRYIINQAEENDKNLGKGNKHEGVRSIETAIKHIMERFRMLIDTIESPLNNITYRLPNFNLPYTVTRNSIDILLKNFMVTDESAGMMNMYL